MTQVDNKKIAKNTLYMYLRMLVTMVVSLFTTRIVYQALGIDNFGIYNVVGSIIVFFTFINAGLTSATRRYITAELAKGDEESQRNVFNLSLWAHILIAGIILILGETIGLWVVNSLLNLPEDRVFAANVVYQLSVLAALLSVMQAPFSAAITANERMNIYAYLSILDVVLRLSVAFIVMISTDDKLIVYAICIFLVSFLDVGVNLAYCHRFFPMCRYKRPHDKQLLREMFGYMGWQLTGQGMVVLANQGVTVLVNMFFTVAANAAMGVSNQITHIVNNFVTNFQIAFNPQITKLYVSNNYNDLTQLANRCSRISSYLVLMFLVPICFQIHNFLTLWLGEYPLYTIEFCIYTLIAIFIDAISAPLWMILASDTNIKKYQIVLTSIYSLNFIGAYVVLKLGFEPYSVIIVRVVVMSIAVMARLLLVKEKISSFSIIGWLKSIMLNCGKVLIIPAICILLMMQFSIPNMIVELFIYGGISFLSVCLSIYLLGLTQTERAVINSKVKNILINRRNGCDDI